MENQEAGRNFTVIDTGLYRSIISISSEITWLTHLLQDLQIPFQASSLIYRDNHAVISIASNPTFHKNTKYIEIDCHFIHDKIQLGQLNFYPFVPHTN